MGHFSLVIVLMSFRGASCYFVDRFHGRGIRTILEIAKPARLMNSRNPQMKNEK